MFYGVQHRRPVRARGRRRARADGPRRRRHPAHLRRARGAGQPAGAPPRRAAASARRPRRHLRHQQRRRGSRRCSPPTRSARCRSTSTTATSRTSCATSSTTPTSSRSCYDAEFAPRIAAVRDDAPDAAHLVAIDDGSGADDSALGSGRLRGRARRRLARARLRRALRRRHLHPLHRRHHRHAQGRDVAPGGRVLRARRAASTSYTGERRRRRVRRSPSEADARADAGSSSLHRRRSCTAPRSGATISGSFEGNTDGAHRRSSTPTTCGALVEKHEINDDRASPATRWRRPLIEALDEPTASVRRCRRCSSVSVDRGDLLADGEGRSFLERFPNLVIADAIGSTETGHQRHRAWSRRATRRRAACRRCKRRPTRSCSTTT